jgi:predicted nucleic acid-binding protein
VHAVLLVVEAGTKDITKWQANAHDAARPMDLADAALVRVAEREGIRRIFTVGRKDFGVYRLHGRVRPNLVP